MARKRYLELPGLRAHYDEIKDRVVLTSTSPKLKADGFKVPLEQNTRSDRAVRGLLETAGIIRHEPPTVKVNWNDDKCIAIAGNDGIGKTAFGSILASALSDIGKRVLLIDTVAGTDRTFRFTPHRSERPLEAMPELEYAETNHGWSVILAPETPEAKASFQSKTTEVHLFMEKLKSTYDVLIFDTSEGFLRGCEYSPFLRHFSNILLLAHPYRQGDEQAREFIGRLPQTFAVNSLSTGSKWQESPYRETSKYFGSWPHMQDFYRLDNDALLSRGEPLALMHREILPHLPLAFRP